MTLPEKTKAQILIQDPYAGLAQIKVVEEGIPRDGYTGFLLQKIKPYGSAFAMNLRSVEHSERFPSMPSFRPLLNTFWISDNNIIHTSTPNADDTYSTFAHEIAHLIGNLGHVEDNQIPNLMSSSDTVGKSYYLNSDQCQAINDFLN